MIAQLCLFTKNPGIALLKWVKFLVSKLYLNEAIYVYIIQAWKEM